VKKLASEPQTLQELYAQFQRHNRIKNLAPATLQYYEHWLEPFFRFFEDRTIESITQNDVEEFILYLKRKPTMEDTTVNTCLRAVRAFLYFAMERDYLSSFKIKLIRVTEKVKEPYSKGELALLLTKPDLKTCRFSTYRNWVMVNFLLATGCRASTLVNIKIGDLDLQAGTVLFQHSKTRSQLVMPLSTTICDILNEYLQYRKGEPGDILFVSETGKAFSVSALECAIRNYNLSRGVEKTSLHLFRHSFAKFYITAGGDHFRLQKLLGHTDLTMTKRYVALYADDLRSNYDRLNPLEQVAAAKAKRLSMKGKT